MSCVHSTPAQGRSRGRAPVFLIREYPRLPGLPSDVYGIMTRRSDYARPRPYAELDQALHTLGGGGGYVLLLLGVHTWHEVHDCDLTLEPSGREGTRRKDRREAAGQSDGVQCEHQERERNRTAVRIGRRREELDRSNFSYRRRA